MKKLLLALTLTLVSSSAYASSCTYTFKDASGATQTINADCDGSSHINTAFGSNKLISIAPTVTSGSAYTANNAVGGWQQTSVFRTTVVPSGLLTSLSIMSKGGQTVNFIVYAFAKSTANLSSTCTDKSAFSLNSADLSALIPGFPITLIPGVMAGGATQSQASVALSTSVSNLDGTASQNISFCIVTSGTPTFASTSDILMGLSISQD
jgi:hypothetical protein